MTVQTIVLREFEPVVLSAETLPQSALKLLHNNYRNVVKIEPHLFRNQIKLTAQGWVGHLPLAPNLRLSLLPKTPLRNLFGMLEVAYNIPIKRLGGLIDADSLAEFYERLAAILAHDVLQQAKRGLYKQYLARRERLPFVRGRLAVRELHHVDQRVMCEYEEVSADIAHNQILYYTLSQILAANICSPRTLPTVSRARRVLHGTISLVEFNSADIAALTYDRLSEPYQPMHALCAFFLDHIGPSHCAGDYKMVPFLLNMAHLFEAFVFRKLERVSAETPYDVRDQVSVSLDPSHKLNYKIDIVLRHRDTREPICVLDTKYKRHKKPSTDDFNQVVNYALSQNCTSAFLIYPHADLNHFRVVNGEVVVSTVPFDLSADFEQASQQLFEAITTHPTKP